MIVHNKISDQWIIFLLVEILCASCRFITSNFSEMAFKASASVSITVSPNNVLTGVSSVSAKEISRSESGTDSPVSLS